MIAQQFYIKAFSNKAFFFLMYSAFAFQQSLCLSKLTFTLKADRTEKQVNKQKTAFLEFVHLSVLRTSLCPFFLMLFVLQTKI